MKKKKMQTNYFLGFKQPCKVTGCQEFPQGNFLSWENTNWFLNSSRGTVNTNTNNFSSSKNTKRKYKLVPQLKSWHGKD